MKRRMWLVVTIAAIAWGSVEPLHAAPLHSSQFNHRYEGDNFGAQLTGVNSTFDVNAGEVPTWAPTTDGDVLTYQNTIADGGAWFDSLNWDADVDDSVGWTVEFRIRIGTDGVEDPDFATFQWFGKEDGSSSSTRRAGVAVGQSKVYISTLNTTPIDASDNTDGFHTFRIAQPADSSEITVWRDGLEVFNGLSRTSNNSGLDMYFGDGSGGFGGPTVEVDYFRWDSTGPYEPVPEPSAAVLIATVGLGFGCWVRLRQSL